MFKNLGLLLDAGVEKDEAGLSESQLDALVLRFSGSFCLNEDVYSLARCRNSFSDWLVSGSRVGGWSWTVGFRTWGGSSTEGRRGKIGGRKG